MQIDETGQRWSIQKPVVVNGLPEYEGFRVGECGLCQRSNAVLQYGLESVLFTEKKEPVVVYFNLCCQCYKTGREMDKHVGYCTLLCLLGSWVKVMGHKACTVL